ncbi:diguanylate cyclase [Actinoplanes oblitus]|uniref:Diguanylate cyclase n=1 Tax=Actinoplanes oblitus TaxID=3040509 RepID=A0ABY8WDT7_9ACTN|nr:diguanylate cyclase [Actinoplanes oblitus]WIM95223.1 diguanylate cyclase [Actinoplanes oblitus]
MRVRNWIAVVVSVLLLAAAGGIAIAVNRRALSAADAVHRADSTELATNNATLTGQLQLLSAQELAQVLADHSLSLVKGDATDHLVLVNAAAKSSTFQYGMVLTALDGSVLNASRAAGLPDPGDAGWAPMREQFTEGARVGFSAVMTVDDIPLAAVAVPILLGGAPAGFLVGFNQVATTSLQKYTQQLQSDTHRTDVVDSTGTVAASSVPDLVGGRTDASIIAKLGREGTYFVDYRSGGTDMIAIVVGGLPSGYSYVRTQTKSQFDGAVHRRSQTVNITLLAMLLIGVVGISVLGYRGQIQRRRADERFQALFQHAPDIVTVIDRAGTMIFTSPSSAAILGFESGALAGHSVFDMVHPDDQGAMRDRLEALLADPAAVLRLQCRVRAASGHYRWFDFTASNQMANPALNGVVINARDISENRAFQERLAHEAQHDPLTGLPNRRRMQDALSNSLRRDPVAVLFVDLDGFKPVNDVHGHEAGDELLRQVAERLSGCIRAGDVLARVGGDEFVVLMPGVLSAGDVAATANRVRTMVEMPFRIAGQQITIGASVGVHMAGPAEDPDAALRAADHAMYEIKRSGGSRAPRGVLASIGRHRAAE